MTERKPPGTSSETWIDAQIRVAREQGAFDNLPGAGKPLPNLGQEYDPLWWVKQLVGAVPGLVGIGGGVISGLI
jgi:DnaJ-like protein